MLWKLDAKGQYIAAQLCPAINNISQTRALPCPPGSQKARLLAWHAHQSSLVNVHMPLAVSAYLVIAGQLFGGELSNGSLRDTAACDGCFCLSPPAVFFASNSRFLSLSLSFFRKGGGKEDPCPGASAPPICFSLSL